MFDRQVSARVLVRECVCVCVCVLGQIVNTFLGSKLFQLVLWGHVQMLYELAKRKRKNKQNILVLTNCPCAIVVLFSSI